MASSGMLFASAQANEVPKAKGSACLFHKATVPRRSVSLSPFRSDRGSWYLDAMQCAVGRAIPVDEVSHYIDKTVAALGPAARACLRILSPLWAAHADTQRILLFGCGGKKKRRCSKRCGSTPAI